MPEIGEIRRGKEIGKGCPSHKYIWASCADCGKQRWAFMLKGEPKRKRCPVCSHTGERAYNWTGEPFRRGDYNIIHLLKGDFFLPMADKTGCILEHRLIMAKHLGRNLQLWEIVHHKGDKYPKGSKENKLDNRIENLQLVSDDRHKQITLLEMRISRLEKRLILLETENSLLRKQYEKSY